MASDLAANYRKRLSWLFVIGSLIGWWLGALFGDAFSAQAGADAPAEVSLDEYRARLGQVRHILGQAAQRVYKAEGVSTADADTLLPLQERATISRLLPERLTVVTPAGQCTVDNHRIQTALDEIGQAADETDLRERLQALHAHLVILERYANEIPDGAMANVQGILARDEFQPIRKTKTPLAYLSEWLLAWLEKILDRLPWQARTIVDVTDPWSNLWVQGVLWVGTLLLLVRGVISLVRRLHRLPTKAEDATRIILGEPVAPDLDADDLLAHAQTAAEAGDWRQAVRKVYIALLYELDRQKVLSLNPAWTNREYLSAVRTQAYLYPAMHELTDCFDRLWYGQHQGSQKDYERCLLRYQEARAALAKVTQSPSSLG
jgi:hypothetical protein